MLLCLFLGCSSLNAQFISTIAGNGTYGSAGNGGPAIAAQVETPSKIVVSANGDIYFAEYNNNIIRKITASTGIITTICGQRGLGTYSGDGGPAIVATFRHIKGMAVDVIGNIYFSDSPNHRIRKITASTGIITTICGTGSAYGSAGGFSGDGGLATAATISFPSGIAVGSTGDIYFCDSQNNRVRKITASTGIITTICGNGASATFPYVGVNGGLATVAIIGKPLAIALDPNENIYIGLELSVCKITANTGIINIITGNNTFSSGDGHPATSVTIGIGSLTDFGNICIDADDNVYISNRYIKLTQIYTFAVYFLLHSAS